MGVQRGEIESESILKKRRLLKSRAVSPRASTPVCDIYRRRDGALPLPRALANALSRADFHRVLAD